MGKFRQNFSKISKKSRKMTKISQKFYEKIETRKRCKGVHCVDLGESFPTHIYLQNLASIQPRTSLLKFEGGGFSAAIIFLPFSDFLILRTLHFSSGSHS